jgi:hypothetical protein
MENTALETGRAKVTDLRSHSSSISMAVARQSEDLEDNDLNNLILRSPVCDILFETDCCALGESVAWPGAVSRVPIH